MLHKMERGKTSDSCQAEETKHAHFCKNLLFGRHLRPASFVHPSLSIEPQSSLSIIPEQNERTCQSFSSPFQ